LWLKEDCFITDLIESEGFEKLVNEDDNIFELFRELCTAPYCRNGRILNNFFELAFFSGLLNRQPEDYGAMMHSFLPPYVEGLRLGYISKYQFVVLVLVLTVIVASISWLLIEKPAIKLKRDPLNPLK